MFRWEVNQRLTALVIVFILCLGALVMLRMSEPDFRAALLTIGLALSALACARVLPRWGLADPMIVTLTSFLCALGTLLQYSMNQTAGGLSHAWFYLAGLPVMIAAAAITRNTYSLRKYRLAVYIAGIVLLGVTLTSDFFEHNGARSWIPLIVRNGRWLFTVQPSEFVKILMIVMMADALSDNTTPYGPLLAAGVAASFLLLIFFQHDYGTGLLYFITALLMMFVGTGDIRVLGGGVACGSIAAVTLYQISDTVRDRVSLLDNPFRLPTGIGKQLVQSLTAIANGGATGIGLGLGRSTAIPLYDSDFVFAAVCEQFGILFGLCVVFIYGLIVWRGMRFALRSKRRFHALLAVGCSVLIGSQTFVIIGGVIKMIPLTGVTLPFISSGGSSMLSCMAQIGILSGVYARTTRESSGSDELVGELSV